MVELVRGSVFDSKCDLLIVPCNNYGGVTSRVASELISREIPYYAERVSAGHVRFVGNMNNFTNAAEVGFAASVDVNHSVRTER